MKWLALAVTLALQVTTPPSREDYPGQADHAEPPAGWTCVHQNIDLSVPPEHDCNCERSCDSETGKVIEDRHCKTWCWPKACGCDMSNMQACK